MNYHTVLTRGSKIKGWLDDVLVLELVPLLVVVLVVVGLVFVGGWNTNG